MLSSHIGKERKLIEEVSVLNKKFSLSEWNDFLNRCDGYNIALQTIMLLEDVPYEVKIQAFDKHENKLGMVKLCATISQDKEFLRFLLDYMLHLVKTDSESK